MLKKLLLSIIIGMSFISIDAMLPAAPEIEYQGPQQAINPDEIEINALEDNYTIGWIMYRYLPDHIAEITLFEVDKDTRNKKELRVGQHLFQKCVDHIIACGCKKLIWTVNPTDNLDLKTICLIYEKIVKKLNNSESYTFTKSEEHVELHNKIDMALTFNNA